MPEFNGKVAVISFQEINKLYTGELVLTPGTLIINEGSLGIFESQSTYYVKIHWFAGVRG